MTKRSSKIKTDQLINSIKLLVSEARTHIASNINTQLLYTYWQVGQLLLYKEQSEKMNEISLNTFITDISKQLTVALGKGFSRSNLFAMRNFHLRFSLEKKVLKSVLTLSGHKEILTRPEKS